MKQQRLPTFLAWDSFSEEIKPWLDSLIVFQIFMQEKKVINVCEMLSSLFNPLTTPQIYLMTPLEGHGSLRKRSNVLAVTCIVLQSQKVLCERQWSDIKCLNDDMLLCSGLLLLHRAFCVKLVFVSNFKLRTFLSFGSLSYAAHSTESLCKHFIS